MTLLSSDTYSRQKPFMIPKSARSLQR